MYPRVTLLVLNLIYLTFYGGSIWISQGAKPIGHLPYRWGAYTGMMAAWMSLVLIVSCALTFVGGNMFGGTVLAIVAALAAVSSLGILLRRKFGVAAFALANAILILMSPFAESMRGQTFLLTIRDKPASPAELAEHLKSFPLLISLVFAAAYFVVTLIYFKRRWGLLGKGG
jgi:hypothetical protein